MRPPDIPADRQPTRLLAPTRASASHAPLAWMRTLRWRLALMNAALVLVLLLCFSLVLNAATTRILYDNEFSVFQSEAKAAVATGQREFDAEVRGHAGTAGCAAAVPFQQAFTDAVQRPLIASHVGVQAVYLLDAYGTVLTPVTNQAPVGSPGPDLVNASMAQLRSQVRAVILSGTSGGTGYLTSVAYTTSARGQHIGVVLVADRFYTASHCVSTHNTQVGIVEVVTSFPRAQFILAGIHLTLLVFSLAALLLTILISVPLASGALAPLTRMIHIARRIADGDLSQRVRLPQSDDEVGQVARAFDEMIERIEMAFTVQRSSEERMRQFIADASHELRTPLTSIRGYTDVLLRGAKDDPAVTERVLRATQREAERMTRLVNDLLTLARLDAGRPLELQPLDLMALAGEAVDQARILAGSREVSMHGDGQGRLDVRADADRLKQVLLVLLDNALKYGRPGADGWVRVDVSRTARTADISVSDNGRGIPPEDLPHIFDRFYRVERAARQRRITASSQPGRSGALAGTIYPPRDDQRTPTAGGSGLGLSIARAIIEAHGGRISVRSTVGGGTTFSIALPIASDGSARRAATTDIG